MSIDEHDNMKDADNQSFLSKLNPFKQLFKNKKQHSENNMTCIKCGSKSITGNFRENNEDSLFVDPENRFFIVADGMGGQAAGEKASALAIELVSKGLSQNAQWSEMASEDVIKIIDESVAEANTEIMALGEIDPDMHKMGTTVTFIVAAGNQFYAGGVGDSRTYQLRDNELKQLTTDHSLTQALVDAGTISQEDAATHRYRNVLYRYLGTKEGGTGTEPTIVTPQSGDRYLICSDGVTDGVDDPDLKSLLESTEDPQEACESIIKAAEEGGSKDNITCIVLHIN